MTAPTVSPDWTIDAVATADGVALVIRITLAGVPTTLRLRMDRPGARHLSDGLLAAAGDGRMRTAPHPQQLEGDGHG